MTVDELLTMMNFFNTEGKFKQPKMITHEDYVETCLIDDKGNKVEVKFYPAKENEK